MAADRYYRMSVKASVAALCQSVGWHGIHNGTCDILSDVAVRYLLTLGRTAAEYSAHAQRTETNISDVYQAFNRLDINTDCLLEYVENVTVPELPPVPPTLPLSRPQTHVRDETGTWVCRNKKRRSVERKGEGGSAGEEGEDEEEEDEDEEWEEIPGYLPPLPQISKEVDCEDTESGIHMTEEDEATLATPTSLKSPLVTGTAGLPSYAHLRTLSEGDEEGTGSRRSSFSDEFTARTEGTTAQAIASPPVSKVQATPTGAIDTPTSSEPVQRQLKPTADDQKERVLLPPPRPKPDPLIIPPPQSVTTPQPQQQQDEGTPLLKSPQMPPLHLISPRTPLSPGQSLPQLSSFHSMNKTPPTSPFLLKQVRPVLHPLTAGSASNQSISRSGSDGRTDTSLVSVPLKEVSVALKILSPPKVKPPLTAAPPAVQQTVSTVYPIASTAVQQTAASTAAVLSASVVSHSPSPVLSPSSPQSATELSPSSSVPLSPQPVTVTTATPPAPADVHVSPLVSPCSHSPSPVPRPASPLHEDESRHDDGQPASPFTPSTPDNNEEEVSEKAHVSHEEDLVSLDDPTAFDDDDSHVTPKDSHMTPEGSHVTPEADHAIIEDDHVMPLTSPSSAGSPLVQSQPLPNVEIESDFSSSSSSSPLSIKAPEDKSVSSPSSLPHSLAPLPPQRPSFHTTPSPQSTSPTPQTTLSSPHTPHSLAPLPPLELTSAQSQPSWLAPPPYSIAPPTQSLVGSFSYTKNKSPLSNQEEEEDSSDSDSSVSVEYPFQANMPSLQVPANTSPPPFTPSSHLTSPPSSPIALPSISSPSPSPVPSVGREAGGGVAPQSLTIRINKSNLAKELNKETPKATDLIISSSKVEKVKSILPVPLQSRIPTVSKSSPISKSKSVAKDQTVAKTVTKELRQTTKDLTVSKEVPRQATKDLIVSRLVTKDLTVSKPVSKDLTVSSSEYQRVDSIESLTPPSSLIVKILRKHLVKQEKLPTVSTAAVEETRLVVGNPAQSGSLGVKINLRGQKRKVQGKGLLTPTRKRELETGSVVVSEPKKMKIETSDNSSSSEEELRSVTKGSSSMSSDSSTTGKKRRQKTTVHSLRAQPHKEERDDDEDKSISGGLKLRLKLPQPSPVSTGGRRISQRSVAVPVPKESKNAKSADSLLIKSSAPIKVPSIKVPKAAVVITSTTTSSSGTSVADTGPEVYICPICERPDDGTPMICCDNCDIWLHMRCVGLMSAPPDDKKWFCPSCNAKKNKKLKKR